MTEVHIKYSNPFQIIIFDLWRGKFESHPVVQLYKIVEVIQRNIDNKYSALIEYAQINSSNMIYINSSPK